MFSDCRYRRVGLFCGLREIRDAHRKDRVNVDTQKYDTFAENLCSFCIAVNRDGKQQGEMWVCLLFDIGGVYLPFGNYEFW